MRRSINHQDKMRGTSVKISENFTRLLILCLGLFCLMPCVKVRADGVFGDKIITLRGVVRDSQTRRALPYATISMPDGEIGTVSNSDGEFIFKIKESQLGDGVAKVSHIGYRTMLIDIADVAGRQRAFSIWLTPTSTLLPEVTVSGRDPREIVEQAMMKVEDNYSAERQMLTGFYRETARKRRHFINIAEAVVEVSKTSYARGDVSGDRVRVVKGRKLLSQKSGDTLAVKLVGGPTVAVFLDIVKNPNELLSPEAMDLYFYQLESVTDIDDRHHYVVAFYPQYATEWALYFGRYYIDMETLTLTRAEFMLDLTDRAKAIRAILYKKPASLRFRPIEVSYIVDYKPSADGRSRLNYVRSEICFRCDWKRKLFSTEYAVNSEMVVTDSRPAVGQEISRHEQFQPNHVFSDEASYFNDPDFWGEYNIIAPEESLEHAVKKLTKEVKSEK